MAEAIRMPLLSDTMKEGVIAEWHKKVGDYIKADDIIADVETDKATMEVMPYVEGTLLYIGVPKGKGVPVNGIMAIIGKAGEDIQAILNTEAGDVPTPEKRESESGNVVSENVSDENDTAKEPNQERLKASPLAKKLASDKGIDLHKISGSGDGGRIIKKDVDEFKISAPEIVSNNNVVENLKPVELNLKTISEKIGGNVLKESHTDLPLTQMRKIIAQKLAQSKFSAPHFYLTMTLTMDNAIAARKIFNEIAKVKISFNDIIIKACATALRKHPEINSSWMGDFIRQNNHIHIGSAVAVEEGLIVPVIKFADTKTLSEIAEETNNLYNKARNKKIQPAEFTGNTFTISNLGMMDIDEFTAIINPPDSCILAVGKIAKVPVVENDAVVIRNKMKITLSCDHRIVDGAKGSLFLKTLKTYLEDPATMLV